MVLKTIDQSLGGNFGDDEVEKNVALFVVDRSRTNQLGSTVALIAPLFKKLPTCWKLHPDRVSIAERLATPYF